MTVFGDDARLAELVRSRFGVVEDCEHRGHQHEDRPATHTSTLYFANGSVADTDDDDVSDAMANSHRSNQWR